MSIQVEKSPSVTFDEKKTAALESILETLNKQASAVKSVTVLSNFSVDKESSNLNNQTIAHGLVVRVGKNYKLSNDDKIWFHPTIAKGRSVYKIDNATAKSSFKGLNLSTTDSVGEYTISKPDQFGCEKVEHRIVVSVSAKSLLTDKYNGWLESGITAGELDLQWKRMKFNNAYSIAKKSELMRDEIAKKISASATLIHSDTINGVFSDVSDVYFANGAVKSTAATDILVKSSSLGGYRLYKSTDSSKKFFPADLGISDAYYAWEDLTQQNCERIVNTCMWEGSLPFNTSVMQPPAIKDIKGMEENYEFALQDILRMRHCAFAPSDQLVDKINPSDMLKLTPTQQQSSAAREFIDAPLTMDHAIMKNLMNNIDSVQNHFKNFKLFNPKYVSNGRLHIPREVYEHVV
jgi:hypothetical protein